MSLLFLILDDYYFLPTFDTNYLFLYLLLWAILYFILDDSDDEDSDDGGGEAASRSNAAEDASRKAERKWKREYGKDCVCCGFEINRSDCVSLFLFLLLLLAITTEDGFDFDLCVSDWIPEQIVGKTFR